MIFLTFECLIDQYFEAFYSIDRYRKINLKHLINSNHDKLPWGETNHSWWLQQWITLLRTVFAVWCM
jgi:hypothetical protein